ncbi:Sec1 domain-containing protein 2, partial [Cladochytrium tenue]
STIRPPTLVLITSSHLARRADLLRGLLRAGYSTPSSSIAIVPYAACTCVCTALSDHAHAHDLGLEPDLLAAFDAYLFAGAGAGATGAAGSAATEQPLAQQPRQSYFDAVAERIAVWLRNDAEKRGVDLPSGPRARVLHLPLACASVTNDLFTIPSADSFFPLLPAPRNSSKLVARCMIPQSLNSARRRSEKGIAVILVDRNLDLTSPLCNADNMLDQMNRMLGHHEVGQSLDLEIPLDYFLTDADDGLGLVAATIAHGSDPDATDLLTVLASLGQKEGLVAVRKRLVDLLAHEAPGARPKVLGRPTLAQLERLLAAFRGDERALYAHGPLLECLAAAVHAFKLGLTSRWEDVLGMQKLIGLTLAESVESASIVAPVLDVLSQVDVGLARLSFVNSSEATLRTPPRSPVLSSPRRLSQASPPVTASRLRQQEAPTPPHQEHQQPPFGISDALRLLAFSFSLVGPDVPFDDEDRLTLTNAMRKTFLATQKGVNPMIVDMWIETCFERLVDIARARSQFPEY